MVEVSQISEFGKIFIFMIMGGVLVSLLFFVAGLIAPKNPNPEKLSTYECGEEPVGNSWIQFNPKFYVIALVFLLFDVEIAFIFPWATVFGQQELINIDSRWGWMALAEMFLFIAILLIGLAYVWVKGDLNWIRPHPMKPQIQTNIPSSVYETINSEEYIIRNFSTETSTNKEQVTKQPESIRLTKPAFKPTFRKPSV